MHSIVMCRLVIPFSSMLMAKALPKPCQASALPAMRRMRKLLSQPPSLRKLAKAVHYLNQYSNTDDKVMTFIAKKGYA